MIKALETGVTWVVRLCFEISLTPLLLLWALISRLNTRRIDVGIGPEPIVTHRSQQRALQAAGYSAETYVTHLFFITDDFDLVPPQARLLRLLFPFLMAFRVLWRYRCLYVYFNGGVLGLHARWLWRLEPWLYRIAGLKTVVTAYGSDVQDLSRTPNLLYKAAMSVDYPLFRHQRRRISHHIDLWTRHADCIIGGCDWVDYLVHWDVLIPAHFCVDTDRWQPRKPPATDSSVPLRVLHSPNHRTIKGTRHFEQAVEQLRSEGVPIEIIILERVPNEQIEAMMATVDVVADQLIIGWYGNFAVEAMAMGKPALAYLRQDLLELFTAYDVIAPDEVPVINCTVFTVKDVLRDLALHRDQLAAHGARSRAYALKYHSIDAIGAVFDRVNRQVGLQPKV